MGTLTFSIDIIMSSDNSYSFTSFLPNWMTFVPFSCLIIVAAAAAKSLQLCLTLCDPVGGSPPGSTIPGILQARTLEWVSISFSNA